MPSSVARDFAVPTLLAGLIAAAWFAGCIGSASAAQQDSERLAWKLAYDQGGRIEKMVDPAGRETRYQYAFDAAKRLRKVVRSLADGQAVTREFDEFGRLVRMSDSAGTVSYGYDQWNRLVRVERQGSPAVVYGYDTSNRITRLQVGDFYQVEYIYDFLGRLASIKTPVGEVRYEYLTGQGQVMRTLPNGVKTIWSYDPRGRLLELVHVNARNIILAEYKYQYRADGLIAAIAEQSGEGRVVKSYGYDQLGRLVSVKGPQSYEYAYDKVGNRLKATSKNEAPKNYTYDWIGRLESIDHQPVSQDAVGNIASLPVNGNNISYLYNQDGRLIQANGGAVTYTYDGNGRLIARRAGDVETAYIPDPLASMWRPLVVMKNGRATDLIVWSAAGPLLIIRGGEPEYLLHDHVGSVRLLVDSRGSVIHRLNYDPFGAIPALDNTSDFSPRFGGLFWDPKAQLYITSARGYAPALGRWLQMDPLKTLPLGDQRNISPFTYCVDDPVNFVDTTGHDPDTLPYSLELTKNFFIDLPSTIAEDWRATGDFWSSAGKSGWEFGPQPGSWAYTAGQIGGIGYQRAVQGALVTNLGASAIAALPVFAQMSSSLGAFYQNFASDLRASTILYFENLGSAMNSLPRLSSQAGQFVRNTLITGAIYYNVLIPRTTTTVIEDEEQMLSTATSEGALQKQEWGAGALGNLPDRIVLNRIQKVIHAAALLTTSPSWIPQLGLWRNRVPYENVNNVDDAQELVEATLDYEKHPVVPKNSRVLDSRTTDTGVARTLTPSTTISGMITTSLVASSTPLSGAELAKWNSEHNGKALPQAGSNTRGDRPDENFSLLSSTNSRDARDGIDGESRMSPSQVGGVYLGGSGQALAGLGLLSGIARSTDGDLVLISKSGGETKLPPLRLDDLVTVFRSVYMNGEGPTVTIDPNPQNPEGAVMIIRHSKATENTYVGWVLYQADRIMKGYTLGTDNISRKSIVSSVAGFANVLDKIYFGGEDPEKLRNEGIWERFWIVPAQVHRFNGPKDQLTLLDVPLKVKTQEMKWQNGALVDDPDGKSSPGAIAFTDWFTSRYDRIAREQLLTPPPESGMSEPVPVFAELRRIALMTAIAEKLRDQGVPMPFWMRDYQVRSVPFEKTTPGLEITRSNGRISARVYGGVGLSAADDVVKDFDPNTEPQGLEKATAEEVRQDLTRAARLEAAVISQLPSAAPLKVQALAQQGAGYQAIGIPGAETKALSPARLEETDLVVPVEGGDAIRLARSYNSFFDPAGPWGRGWAFDLPRLVQGRLPVRREDNRVTYAPVYELVTPLNSRYARFSKIDAVPALNGSRLQVPDKPDAFFGIADGKPDFLSAPTRELLWKDGAIWHFSEAGDLVATERAGSRVVYERDGKGRVTRIVGLLGRRPVASIELQYDAAERLESARTAVAGHEVVVRYEYNEAGRLSGVVSDAGRLGYRYEDGLVTEVTFRSPGTDPKNAQEKILRRYQYGPRGQLSAEFDADGTRTDYRIASDPDGSTITIGQAGPGAASAMMRYDRNFRPLEGRTADGTLANWSYPEGGGVVITVVTTDGQKTQITESADQRTRTLGEGTRKLTGQYDALGRLVSIDDSGLSLLQRELSPDGRLLRTVAGKTATNLEYDGDGLVSRTIVSPPEEKDQFKHWQETKLDPKGLPREITDYRGLKVHVDYTAAGLLRSMVSERDGKDLGFEIDRDADGRLQDIRSSWGEQRYAYDADGQLTNLATDQSGKTTSAEWNSGLLHKIRQTDGGEYILTYYEGEKHQRLLKKITAPDQLVMGYQYDDSNRLSQIDVGAIYRLSLGYDREGRLAEWTYFPPKR